MELDINALVEAIESEVEHVSCGPIVGLSVTRQGETIILRGYCRTYHASQIAYQAALELIEGSAYLINRICVH